MVDNPIKLETLNARIRTSLRALDTANDALLSQLLMQVKADMHRLDEHLGGLHTTLKTLATENDEAAIHLRRKIQALQAGPKPLLVYTRDALRYAPWIHYRLANAYRKAGDRMEAEWHTASALWAVPHIGPPDLNQHNKTR